MREAATPHANVEHFGTLADGSRIELYTLRSDKLQVRVSTFGGRIVDLKLAEPGGEWAGIALGFDSLERYLTDRAYMGALIGRCANRIARGQFNLGQNTYHVSRNDGVHSLHGGLSGFDQRVWLARARLGTLTLSYTSKDGEEGYPGDLSARVRYSVAGSELRLDYEARATSDTPVNLTSHVYFNLRADGCSDVSDHVVRIYAERFTPVDDSLIPTGELRSVDGTPFDFRKPHSIGERIDSKDPQLVVAQGYDHNWVLFGCEKGVGLAAEVYEPLSGRVLEVFTSEPGLQFYTGNQLGAPDGPAAQQHPRRSGFCLETQHFPDSPNHPDFPSTILKAGQVFRSQTVYRFSNSR